MGVYYRDLKLEKLSLDQSTNMNVLDFGLSSMTQQFNHNGLLHTTFGTPTYISQQMITIKG